MLRHTITLLALSTSLTITLAAQGPPSSPDSLLFRAADGTTSEVRQSGPARPLGSVSVEPVSGGIEVTWTMDTAGGCLVPRSVRHRIRAFNEFGTADSVVVVVTYSSQGNLCPGIVTPVPFLLTLRGLPTGWYTLDLQGQQFGQPHSWFTYTTLVP